MFFYLFQISVLLYTSIIAAAIALK